MGSGKGRTKRVNTVKTINGLTDEYKEEVFSESFLYATGLNKINTLLNSTQSPLTDKDFYKIVTQKSSGILTREELLAIEHSGIRRVKVKDLTAKINDLFANNYEYDKQLSLLGEEEKTNYRLSLTGTKQVVDIFKEIKEVLA